VPESDWKIGCGQVSATEVSHPGTTLGYRLAENGTVFAYLPDHEPAVGIPLETLSPDWMSGFAIAAGATALVHDAQYSEGEYPGKIGWGHSSVADAVVFAARAGVGQLLPFHHDPLHDDPAVESLQDRARELWTGEGRPPASAREGMILEL
jgi:hypothetical protein